MKLRRILAALALTAATALMVAALAGAAQSISRPRAHRAARGLVARLRLLGLRCITNEYGTMCKYWVNGKAWGVCHNVTEDGPSDTTVCNRYD